MSVEVRRLSTTLMSAILGCIVFVICIASFAVWVRTRDPNAHVLPSKPIMNRVLSNAVPFYECDKQEGTQGHVKKLARGNGFMHTFEFERLHWCCVNHEIYASPKRYPAVNSLLDRVLFIVMTSSSRMSYVKTIRDTWGADLSLDNLLILSNKANKDHGVLTFPGVSNHGEASQFGSIRTLEHLIKETGEFSNIKNKEWFVLVDDATWVNVPALLGLVRDYDSSCPVIFSHIVSGAWLEDFDYVSGNAGVVISNAALGAMLDRLSSKECISAHFNEIGFSHCAWSSDVQLVHHAAFSPAVPQHSHDTTPHIWYPNIGEKVTYHGASDEDMFKMSSYVNQRWNYRPGGSRPGT
jgi:hypothetical protein